MWVQIESGFRNVATMERSGHAIRVVTGWDFYEDAWRIHVYVAPPGGEESKVHTSVVVAPGLQDAFGLGFAAGINAVDFGK